MLLPHPQFQSGAPTPSAPNLRSAEAWEREPRPPPLGGAEPARRESGECRPAGCSFAGGRRCAESGAPSHLSPGRDQRGSALHLRPALPGIPSSGRTSRTSRTRLGSRRQQVAQDSPPLPQSGRAARPVAPRRSLGRPRRAGWRRTGTGTSWPGCALSSRLAMRTARAAWSARSSARCARSCACARPTPRPCSSGWTPTATAPSPSRSSRAASAALAAGGGAGAARRRNPRPPRPWPGPTPGTQRRTRATRATRATRTRRRRWQPPGARRDPARLGRTFRSVSGTRPSSSPGACVGWRARGDGGVSLCRPYSSVSRFSAFAYSLTFPRLRSPKS